MSTSPDLSHFVQHRQLDVYEQSMARQGYAYGVDLRRSRWLATSTVGNALVRTVDRAWPRLAEHLLAEELLDAQTAPTSLLRELAVHMNLLRAPLPAVRLLRPPQRGRWPLVTAIGSTRGSSLWLVLDAEALLALDADKRAFVLGAGLGHLHCDHAVFFAAHFLANRREGNSSIRTLQSALTPWTKVMTFSADRAGLLACGRLATAVSVIENPPIAIGDDPEPRWLPPLPSPVERIQAIEEFARSSVFARVVAMRARQRELARSVGDAAPPSVPSGSEGRATPPPAPEPEPIHVPADAWSLARVDARLTARLNLL
ncbi:hypothetical protein ENSA5_14760 [Enhygromyxa salina]|uniref:Peptidase M48 domain-containing protein n=1 Tax=Enhygromyxa salina TaxID=215803 RepID=A0A2S9YEJ1_9BACT|nr:hypothetical protein [Enhygromyxa salina]PRQ03544.1 hypothetical protein ENSA5_14760 [Enhygromyxa salina]